MSRPTTAAVTPEVGGAFSVRELTLDEPRVDEVQVRMVAAGVCHTDAAVREGWIPTTFPIVLGHEGAGVVERVGAGVTHVVPGDHVVLTVASCGQCRSCREGHPSFCEMSYALNFAGGRSDGSSSLAEADGHAVKSHFFGQSSFSAFANVAARSVVKVRDDIPLETLAPLGCGVQTGAGTVLNFIKPRSDSTLVVFGSGAVGLSAIMAAKVAKVQRIVAVDLVDSRLDLAKELGATHVVNGGNEDTVARIREISGGGAEYAIDTTGNPRVVDQMIEALGYRGHAVVLAASSPDAEARINLSLALARAILVSTVIEGDAVPHLFIPELIDLYLAGDFPFDRLIRTYPFEAINTAFEESEAGTTVKPVLTFGG